VGAAELVVAILLAVLVVLAFVVDVATKACVVLLVAALVVLFVVDVVELVGVGVFDAGPCAKAQFAQWYELGE